MNRDRQHRGFLLIETAVAIVIVAVSAVAVTELIAAGTRTNAAAHRQATAQNLAASLQEATLNWTPAQLTAANNRTYSPPISAGGDKLAGLDRWSQRLTVQPVDPANLKNVVASSKTLRVTARVDYDAASTCSLQWLVCVP